LITFLSNLRQRMSFITIEPCSEEPLNMSSGTFFFSPKEALDNYPLQLQRQNVRGLNKRALPLGSFPLLFVKRVLLQACEVPASQNEHSHYVCTDNGELKCLRGWTGDVCDVPICKKGCDPLQGYCKRPGECLCKLGALVVNITFPFCEYTLLIL
jgi:hypothetical protein